MTRRACPRRAAIAEEAAAKHPRERSIFFASHPASAEREETLRAAAQRGDPNAGETYADRYRERFRPLRTLLLQDELKLRQYERTLVVLEELRNTAPEDGEIAFFTGEVYRLRDETGDTTRARDAFERALSSPDCPAEVHRSVGLMHLKAGERGPADLEFRRYLELRPDAEDREMIRTYLST